MALYKKNARFKLNFFGDTGDLIHINLMQLNLCHKIYPTLIEFLPTFDGGGSSSNGADAVVTVNPRLYCRCVLRLIKSLKP